MDSIKAFLGRRAKWMKRIMLDIPFSEFRRFTTEQAITALFTHRLRHSPAVIQSHPTRLSRNIFFRSADIHYGIYIPGLQVGDRIRIGLRFYEFENIVTRPDHFQPILPGYEPVAIVSIQCHGVEITIYRNGLLIQPAGLFTLSAVLECKERVMLMRHQGLFHASSNFSYDSGNLVPVPRQWWDKPDKPYHYIYDNAKEATIIACAWHRRQQTRASLTLGAWVARLSYLLQGTVWQSIDDAYDYPILLTSE